VRSRSYESAEAEKSNRRRGQRYCGRARRDRYRDERLCHLARRLLFANRGGSYKQRRWRCATNTRRTAERTATVAAVAAGKLTRAGLLPPLRRHNTMEHALMSVTYTTCACTGVASESPRIDCDGVVAASRLR